MLSMSLVAIVAYLTATAVKSEPIYESLLSSLLKRRGIQTQEEKGEKILQEFIICHGSPLEEQTVDQEEWPASCLLVAVRRNGTELIPKGRTKLMAGDVLVVLSNETDVPEVYDYMERRCAES